MNVYARFSMDGQLLWAEFIDGFYYPICGSILDDFPEIDSKALSLDQAVLMSPYFGNKVIALAYNYKSLVGEKDFFNEPLVFLKSPESVTAHQTEILYPDYSEKVWIEAELTIIIGKAGRNISVEEANAHILGYTCGNDVTAMNILGRDWHLARSKALDTFCPLGPYLVKGLDTSHLEIESFINGRKTQGSYTSDRVLNDCESVALASRYFTLRPGDVILTGTPAGATDALINPGDIVDIKIENLGVLTNRVR